MFRYKRHKNFFKPYIINFNFNMTARISHSWEIREYVSNMENVLSIPCIRDFILLKQYLYSADGYHLVNTVKSNDPQCMIDLQDTFFQNRTSKPPSLKTGNTDKSDNFEIFNVTSVNTKPVSKNYNFNRYTAIILMQLLRY
jgi:hypothetical protein